MVTGVSNVDSLAADRCVDYDDLSGVNLNISKFNVRQASFQWTGIYIRLFTNSQKQREGFCFCSGYVVYQYADQTITLTMLTMGCMFCLIYNCLGFLNYHLLSKTAIFIGHLYWMLRFVLLF